jgi:hypothetical protein
MRRHLAPFERSAQSDVSGRGAERMIATDIGDTA